MDQNLVTFLTLLLGGAIVWGVTWTVKLVARGMVRCGKSKTVGEAYGDMGGWIFGVITSTAFWVVVVVGIWGVGFVAIALWQRVFGG